MLNKFLKKLRKSEDYWKGRVEYCKAKIDYWQQEWHNASDAEDRDAMKTAKKRINYWKRKLELALTKLRQYK